MEKEDGQVHGNWAYIEAAHRNVEARTDIYLP